jgi:hypothetical protein
MSSQDIKEAILAICLGFNSELQVIRTHIGDADDSGNQRLNRLSQSEIICWFPKSNRYPPAPNLRIRGFLFKPERSQDASSGVRIVPVLDSRDHYL